MNDYGPDALKRNAVSPENNNYNAERADEGQNRNKPARIEYKTGEELDVAHHIVKHNVVHVYEDSKQTGIDRTIPLASIKHILRGVSQ